MASYWVSQASGNDSNNGAFAHPWLTLTHAQSGSVSGDLITILDGTFDENNWWKDGVNWHGPTANIGYTGGSNLLAVANANMRTTITLNNIYSYGGDTMFSFTDEVGAYTQHVRILCNDLYGDDETHGTGVGNGGRAHLSIYSKHRAGNNQYDAFFGGFGSLTIDAENVPHFRGDDSVCIEGGGDNILFAVDEFDNTDGTGPFNLTLTGRYTDNRITASRVKITGNINSSDGGVVRVVNGIFMGGSALTISADVTAILIDTDARLATITSGGTVVAVGNTIMPSGFTNFENLTHRARSAGSPGSISGILQA